MAVYSNKTETNSQTFKPQLSLPSALHTLCSTESTHWALLRCVQSALSWLTRTTERHIADGVQCMVTVHCAVNAEPAQSRLQCRFTQFTHRQPAGTATIYRKASKLWTVPTATGCVYVNIIKRAVTKELTKTRMHLLLWYDHA
jgi:hypothetical protein